MRTAPESPLASRQAALRALRDRGLLSELPFDALAEANALKEDGLSDRNHRGGSPLHDLRALPWLSIDGQGARTLDQVTTAEARGKTVRLLVAVADVDALVPAGSALDRCARHNTRTIYTPGATFPLLPESVAAGFGSLRQGQDRRAVVVEMTIDEDGSVTAAEIRRARVRNQAQLTYENVGAWLEGQGSLPKTSIKRTLLRKQILLHAEAAGRLRRRRYARGALPIERWRMEPAFRSARPGTVPGASARELIEDLMVATNEAVARFLQDRGLSALRRLIREPLHWSRVIELATGLGESLPPEPDAAALAGLLGRRRTADPAGFPSLAWSVLQLLGPGEYRIELPGRPDGSLPRHFFLATDDYTHATAPNRRYADLVTQRLLKAALAGAPPPYADRELEELAAHCTRRETDAAAVLDILSPPCAGFN
jgi:exoribonuclease-2